ncbi:MAG TPA: competence/damage-inducible protein A [Bryobacteraceae bacterium]|nr:competence/damage-inducible protein A [Bryobacteraceae bacterium]
MACAEIIAVGSELLTPQKIDTNSLFLTEQLNNLGIEVTRKCVVGDDRERLTSTIRTALAACDVLILSGGLGPTEDDLTRDSVAAAFGRPLIFNQAICDAIEERFRRFNRKMVEINKRQAYVVEGAEILGNDRGTAPGQWVESGGKVTILLPGPPSELKAMFANHCISRLQRLLPPSVIRMRHYRVAGIPESDLDQLIAPVYTKYTNPVTTILSGVGGNEVHLRAHCPTEQEAEALLNEVAGQIEHLLGNRIASRTGETLQKVVGDLLRARAATLSVAESATGGMLGEWITAVPNSSDYFLGGFLTYTDRMKQELLGVPEEVLAAFTAVSEQAAKAMAEGARERTGSDYALSITGFAGPDGTDVGTVFIGLSGAGGTEARRFKVPGDRYRIRALSVQNALDMLRRRLLQ